MKLKRISISALSFFLILSLFFCCLPYGLALNTLAEDSSVSELEDEYDRLEKQLDDAKKELEKLKEQKKNYIEQRENYEDQMHIVSDQIDVVKNEISGLEMSIEDLEKSVANLQTVVDELAISIDENYEQFKLRLKAFHRQDNASTLQLLLNAESFKDFLTRYNVMKAITEHDEELMERLEEDKAYIESQRQELEEQMKELQGQKTELQTQKDNLDSKKDDLEDLSDDAAHAIEKAQSDEKEQQALIEYIDESLEKLEKEIEEATKAASNKDYVGGEFLWPCPDYTRISSPFGYRVHPITGKYKLHSGVDMAAPRGTDILAANSGTVTAAYNYENGAYGKYIIISHGGGRVTLYAHCDDVYVKKGDEVEQGEVIAAVGTTGSSTGYHLHFEVRIDGEYIDPMEFFEKA